MFEPTHDARSRRVRGRSSLHLRASVAIASNSYINSAQSYAGFDYSSTLCKPSSSTFDTGAISAFDFSVVFSPIRMMRDGAVISLVLLPWQGRSTFLAVIFHKLTVCYPFWDFAKFDLFLLFTLFLCFQILVDSYDISIFSFSFSLIFTHFH